MSQLVSSCFTELFNKRVAKTNLQATIHEYAKGVKSPLATHFSLRLPKARKRSILLAVLGAVVLAGLIFWFSPFWNAEMIVEESRVQFVPRVERSVVASELALLRFQEALGQEQGEFRESILSAQRMLTLIESNLGASDKPYKTLRRLQETEDVLRRSKDAIALLSPRDDAEALLVEHASLRIDILLQEVELEKQKNKARLG